NINRLNLHDELIQTFIQDQITETLKPSCIQAYATNFAAKGCPILESLENIVVKQLISAQNKIPDRHLPEGYQDCDLTADTQVREVIKEIAKVERCMYQNAKRNINLGQSEGLYIHCLEGTVFLLQQKDYTAPQEGPMKTKIDQSMWDPVDKRLSWIQTLSKDHQILFYQWILHYESKISIGTLDFQQIKQQVKIQIINPDEFCQWIIEGCPFC
ncbi:hypothetical protein DFH28DRAFT_905312, partial [Melampsora americana]